jgi:hypothetical protein
MPRSAAIYGRISQDPGNTLDGVQRQVSDAVALIKTLPDTVLCQLPGSPLDRKHADAGHWPPGVFVDNDISARRGSRTKRPEYDRLIAAILGADVQTIVSNKSDRIWRNSKQRVNGLEILKDTDTRLVFLQGGQVDLSNIQQKFFVEVMGTFDSYEVEVIAQRQQDASRHNAANGAYHGARPFGFQLAHLDPDGSGVHPAPKSMPDGRPGFCEICGEGRKAGKYRTLIPDPVEAPAVVEIFNLIQRGASVYHVCKYLDGWDIPDPDGTGTISRPPIRTAGGHLWTETGLASIPHLLRSTRYIGKRQHSVGWQGGVRPEGKTYEAHWDGLVSEDVFAAVQEILNDRTPFRRPDSNRPQHLLTGFAFCGVCGARLIIHKVNGKRRYACTTSGTGGRGCVSREAQSVEIEVQRVLYEWLSRNGQLTRALKMAGNTDLQDLLRKREKHEAQKRQLQDKWSDELLTDDEYIRLRNRKAQMISDLNAQIKAAMGAAAGLELPTGAEFRRKWQAAGLDERRAIVRRFIAKVVIHPCGAGNNPDPLLVQVYPGEWAAGIDEAQPLPAPDPASLTSRGKIERFLNDHPGEWFTRGEVAAGAGVTMDEAHKNLKALGATGKAGREWRHRGGQRACFMYSAGGAAWSPRTRAVYERKERPRDKIMRLLNDHRAEWFTLAEISEKAGLTARLPTTHYVLKDLLAGGFIERRWIRRPQQRACYVYTVSGK